MGKTPTKPAAEKEITVADLAKDLKKHKEETSSTIADLQAENKKLANQLKKSVAKEEPVAAPKKKEKPVTPKEAVKYSGDKKEFAGKYCFTGPVVMKDKAPLNTAVIVESLLGGEDEYAPYVNDLIEKKSGLLKKQA